MTKTDIINHHDEWPDECLSCAKLIGGEDRKAVIKAFIRRVYEKSPDNRAIPFVAFAKDYVTLHYRVLPINVRDGLMRELR